MQMDRHFWLSSGARIEWVRPSCSPRSAVDFVHLVQGQLARRSGEIDVSLTAFSCVNMNQTPDWATARDNQYGGMQAEEARRLARLEKENARFKMLWRWRSWKRRTSRRRCAVRHTLRRRGSSGPITGRGFQLLRRSLAATPRPYGTGAMPREPPARPASGQDPHGRTALRNCCTAGSGMSS